MLSTLVSACLGFQGLPTLAQSVYTTPYTFTTFAGTPPNGSADGVGSNAQFYEPYGIAVDMQGTLYVADTYNHTIRKITSAGVVSTLAGRAGASGTNDATGSNARFSFPAGVAVDDAGTVYVGDAGNHTIRKITPAGVVSTLAGLAGSAGTNDGVASNARFNMPFGVAVDSPGNIYVADSGNHTLRKITPAGEVSTLAGLAGSSGSADGAGTNARFNTPYGVAVDSAGNVYVADSSNHTIRKVTPIGVVSTLAGLAGSFGTNDGVGINARFDNPAGVAVNGEGTVYVADTGSCTTRKITPGGVVSTLAGLPHICSSTDGTGNNARFYLPFGVAVDGAGYICVADTYNHTIRKITSAGVVSTLAGSASSVGSADGTGSDARFHRARGVAVDSPGDIYVADTLNHTVRKITSAGVVSTLAGLAGSAGTNDGAGGNARFNWPSGVAVDSAGTVYVADTDNYTIRKITPAGVVSTWAGKAGTSGTNDGAGSNARFGRALYGGPSGIGIDSAGNVYVADTGNHTIRKITSAGVVSTLAGLAGFFGTNDGTGSTARFSSPQGVAVDSAGNVHVADSGNSTIRKVTSAGIVSTVAGRGFTAGTNDGAGGYARFRLPAGLAVDTAGTVYVADTANHAIRKVTSDGVVTTLAGKPGTEGSSDGTGSDAGFNEPRGIAADGTGNLYVADGINNTIRKGVFVQFAPANPVPWTQPPMNGQLTVTLLPPEANGQWRFPWDWVWRNSGQTVSNLVAGNYPLEFRSLAGWLAYPPTGTAVVTNSATVQWTNQYFPTFDALTTTNTGSLTVNLGPSPPTGAGWRFWGETVWREPSSTASNLLPDTYFIQFAPVSGFCQPGSEAVRVSAGATTFVWAVYLMAQQTAVTADLPMPVPTNSISDLTNYPYGFNGQLQSDVGYGSGVAVQTNVVLTAAHLVFSDDTKSYVRQVYWRWQQEAGVFVPQPQAARGWYVLSGYAAQRTNDLLGGLFPGQSSPQSRNLDVAALYFPSPVAGGGSGGYLPSDATPNIWLTSTTPKMLVGYPVDGSLFGDASIVPGVMYQTGPHPYPLSLATDPVADQQVYLATWLLSYPGNSGGPLYVELSGYYYPAGVYLGTLYSGVVPYASLVRGIDSNVVNMITWAQALGDDGTNSTGGGVITITVGTGGSGTLAYLQVNLGPPAAVAAGAAWRLQGTTSWCGNSPFTVTVPQGGSATIEFKAVPGWNLPSAQALTLTLGQLTTTSALYTQSTPVWLGGVRVLPDGALAMTLDGAPGGVYAILASPDLLTPLGSWTEVLRLTNTTGQTTFTNPVPAVTPQYYRARQL